MKKDLRRLLPLFCVLVLLAACVPYSFSPPTQIHINPGDHVDRAVIAMDAAGRSHIAGVVNDRVVYTRTTFGDLHVNLTMTMSSSGTNWKQYSPDIAVTDSGTAWLVWIEQRGNTDKIACYQAFPFFPPFGGYDTGCARLDSGSLTTGNVMVIAQGNQAYALYDAKDISGRIGALWYKELTHPSNTGIIYWYADVLESGYLHSWDAGIDSDGYLHLAFLDDDGYDNERLLYRSNRDTAADGTMKQAWAIVGSNDLEEDTSISLTFYMDGTVERMAVASIYEDLGVDEIWIDSCDAIDCSFVSHISHHVTLPTAWLTQSVITDVELVGIDTMVHLGFIGDDSPSLAPQVYYLDDAFDTDAPLMPSNSRSTLKYDLEAVKVDPRPESPATSSFAALSWGETNLITIEYYSFDGLWQTTVYTTDCTSSLVTGETASNGVYHSGVWQACEDAWFTTKANQAYLPVISK